MTLPPLPKKITGIIFTEIMPQFLPEVKPKKLVELGAIVRKKDQTQMYEPLTDSLRKMQWVKLVGLKAMAIEEDIAREMKPHVFSMDPLGQTAHALCVTDCLIHTKSALDSMAVFLTDLLDLDAEGGERDFKKANFRRLVSEKDLMLKHRMKKLEHWFVQLQKVRDEWIHRSAIRSLAVHGPSKVGILPIPRKLELAPSQQLRLDVNERNFWSTRDFVEYHYTNLLTLFNAIIERCIQIEKRDLTEPIPIPADAEKEMTMFPVRLTEETTIEGFDITIPVSLADW